MTGTFVSLYEYDINGNFRDTIENSVNVKESRVDTESLCAWLAFRGLDSGFFFPEVTNIPDYLEPTHPRYAPKLAATVRAWLALEDKSLTQGKTAKMALDKWIREHAAEFRLTDDEGIPVNQAVEDCSKVANWNPGGGAPKTPSG